MSFLPPKSKNDAMKSQHQLQAGRRNNSFRWSGGGGAVESGTEVSSLKRHTSPLLWIILHSLCCIVSLVLGFRFSRIVLFLLLSSTFSTSNLYADSPLAISTAAHGDVSDLVVGANRTRSGSGGGPVVVGRHGIRIRAWPFPDPGEVMRAHGILQRVQKEQMVRHGVGNPRTLIAVTPTHVRTLQMPHLMGVMHWLMNAPCPVLWIVVEAGGRTNETAGILAMSGLGFLHIGWEKRMPNSWIPRFKMENQMRLLGLRVVRDGKLDGVVVFADDSNMYSLELFEEVQKVKWMGAISMGILVHSRRDGDSSLSSAQKSAEMMTKSLPIQGPSCNSSDQLIGWHLFDRLPFAGRTATHVDDKGVILPQNLEWAGFVMNSRLVWKEAEDKPEWIIDLDDVVGGGSEAVESPLAFVRDHSMVEPLGSCGRRVLTWWLRVEARVDSKFPPRWRLDRPLDITVAAKHTPLQNSEKETTPEEKRGESNNIHVQNRINKTHKIRPKHGSTGRRRRRESRTETEDYVSTIGDTQ